VTDVAGGTSQGATALERDDARRALTEACLDALAGTSDAALRRDLVEKVVVANLRIAHAIARRYRGRGVALEDLEQTAGMALCSACLSFEPARGHDFLSYAVPTIRGAVLRYFRDQGWAVRPPRRIRELQTRILRTASTLDTDELDVAALAAHLGESDAAIAEALAARGCFRPTSLDAPVRDGGSPLAELLVEHAHDAIESVEDRLAAATAIRVLDDRARRILHLRFFEGHSQQEIADELGTSQVQVSRELKRILARLRRIVDDDVAVAG